MSRVLWFLAGAGAGVYGLVRGRRAAEAFTPGGLHDRMGALVLGARLLRDEVAQGTTDRETELRERFTVVPHERHELGFRDESLDPPRSPAETKESST